MTEDQKKRVAELTQFINSEMIDKDKFHVTVADCLLLLESQWNDFCDGVEEGFRIQREIEIMKQLSKETGDAG